MSIELMYYMDLAIRKWHKKVMEALGKRDLKTIKNQVFKMAFNKHIELLKQNYPQAFYGKRVKTIKELQQEYMQGLNLLHAIALAKIFETIKEGEEHYYLNLKITKKQGKINIENVGWNNV